MKNKANLKYLLVILPVLLFACQSGVTNVEETENLDPQIEKLKQFLINEGYPEKLITYHDDYFLVDDIIIPKKHIIDFLNKQTGKPSTNIPTTKQAHGGTGWGLVSISNVQSITVKAHSSVSNSWKDALEDAVDHWNSITQTDISFSYITSGTSDITVYSDSEPTIQNLSICTIARGESPNNGDVGSQVIINEDYHPDTHSILGQCTIGSPTYLSKVWNMIHELGHNIGFRHTNWQPEGEGSAATIPYTPSSDVNSVMNGGQPNTDWAGFSNNDKIGARVLYPDGIATPTISIENTNDLGGQILVELDSSFGSYGYSNSFYKRVNGGSWQLINSTPRTYPNGNYSLTVPATGSTTYDFRVRTKSYHGNIYSPYSSTVSYTVPSGGGGGIL